MGARKIRQAVGTLALVVMMLALHPGKVRAYPDGYTDPDTGKFYQPGAGFDFNPGKMPAKMTWDDIGLPLLNFPLMDDKGAVTMFNPRGYYAYRDIVADSPKVEWTEMGKTTKYPRVYLYCIRRKCMTIKSL
ncbi:MAG: hypothetical protein K2W96_02040 [Gemmataceae bacterium]|nr:hypothetical protein [Gemmataceae bacterium]